MRYRRILLIPIICMMLCSCLAAGVPYTSNPRTLIVYGNTLVDQGRVWRAEELYNSALGKYTKKGDRIGMAVSIIKLGDLYRDLIIRPGHRVDCSNVKEKRGVMYNCPDYLKAEEQYRKAIQLLESVPDSVEKFEFLRLGHMSIGRIYEPDNKSVACSEYRAGLKYYDQAKKLDPTYQVVTEDGTKLDSFIQAVAKNC